MGEMISVDSSAFAEAVSHDLPSQTLCFLYAKDYVDWLSRKPFRDLADVYSASKIYSEMLSFIVEFDLGHDEFVESGARILVPSRDNTGEYHLPGRRYGESKSTME